jgi:glyoxylase-like metal-dependent hydrolase (beta-lactamase superfamily II)
MNKNDAFLLDNIKMQCELFGIPVFEKPKVDEFIDEKSDLKIGDYKIKVLETKGHSPGGLSFMIDGKLFSGDTLFYEEIGRCDLPGASFEEIKESISRKLFALSPLTEVFPGHGLPTTIEHEIEFNAYFGKNSKFL